ncbi:MAG: GNAT family N-acetyltransferase [Gammaproteobacteria bacterium]|nr:MAG: GNAT family N-acetyltransferase [Gammaproteobacteria bacterium]UTW42565.1 GNAT family N-acetyltransferase [bacterium SCSIO 12844]
MNEINFRKAEIADIDDITRIHIESAKYAYKGFISKNNLNQIYKKSDKKLLWHNMLNSKLVNIIVAEYHNLVVGFICFDKFIGDQVIDAVEIKTIYIDPNYIGYGVGSKLINKVICDSRLNKIKKVYLWVLLKNALAIDFYTRKEFIKTKDKRICIDLPNLNLAEIKLIKKLNN